MPDMLQVAYRGTLLSRILGMAKGTPVTFERGIQLFHQEWLRAFQDGDIPKTQWLTENFFEWFADLGCHIELTGDEFEPFFDTSKV